MKDNTGQVANLAKSCNDNIHAEAVNQVLNDAIILVDKPAGITSFGAVARIRWQLSEQAGFIEIKGKDGVVRQKRKKVKVGHTGTLDPFATGLLIILTGKQTKYANDFLKLDKEYLATIRLGATSTTGDIEGEGERQLAKQLKECYLNCTWEVLKVAHHGSKNSSTEEFLRQVQPAYALISAGQENRYGHPHQETVKRLADAGSKVYSTQENGAIIVEVEGGGLLRLEKW